MAAITASTTTTATVQQTLAADAIWDAEITIKTPVGAATSSAVITAIPYLQATGQQGSPQKLVFSDTARAAANIGAEFAQELSNAWAAITALTQLRVNYDLDRAADVATAQANLGTATTAAANALTARNTAFAALATARKGTDAGATATALATYQAADAAWSAATATQSSAQAKLAAAQAALDDPANPPVTFT